MGLKALLVAAFSAVLAGAVGDKNPAVSYVYTQAPRYDAAAWVEGRDRFPSGGTLMAVVAGSRRAIAADFAASVDPTVSFDGAKILFAGKRTADDRWQVWEVAVAGGTPRRVTSGTADCIRPLYLPDGRIVYTRVTTSGSHIEAVPINGGAAVRLTWGVTRVLTDDVLRDGRVLFESATGAKRVRELFTVYPDGTGVESMRCDHGPDRGEARQVASGDIVFRAGDRLARFTSTQAKQAPVSQIEPDAIGPIAEVNAGAWIVAVRNKAGRYGLQQWDLATRLKRDLEVPADAQAVQPAMLGARIPPLRFPSALVPARTAGNLLCVDARVSKPAIDATIKSVRFYAQEAGGTAVVLGETAVESDGSFYVQVPADRPVRLELLGADGKVIRGEHGWFWMRASEQRVCVGCHAGPERAVENKVPAVLLKSTVPANMLGNTGRGK